MRPRAIVIISIAARRRQVALSQEIGYDTGLGWDPAGYVGDAPLWWQAAANRTDNYSINGLNQYTTVNGTSIAHDGNGNLTTDASGRQFTYDAENVLRQALTAAGSQIAEYKYFADGTRRRKITPSATTDYWYWGDQEILEVANQDYTNPDVARRYVRMPGSVDEAFLMIDYTGSGCASGCEVWAHQDRLGSTVMTTDETGAVLDSFTYSPYGESGESTTGFPFRFTGQKLDPETGLYYYKARYYDPKTGRFLQVDPIGYEDQMNLYAYVGNDPINLTDPSGMEIKVGSTVETRSDGTTKSTVYMRFTGAFTNSGGALPTGTTDAGLASALETQIESDYSQTFTDVSGNVTEYKMDANITVETATAANKRHNVELLPHGDPRLGGGIGRAPGLDTGNDILISDATLNAGLMAANPNMSFNRTGSHEFGHSAGLRHPNDPANSITGLPNANLMSQTRNSGSTAVTRDQLRAIFKNPKFR